MKQARYDTIGRTYDTTRKADPEIVKTIVKLLQPSKSGEYLDIACGSGNYTVALSQLGYKIVGIDISEEMLSKARSKSKDVDWYLGSALQLPFENERFSGATCTLAIHHIENNAKAFREAFRIIKSGSRYVIFTATPEQLSQYWLIHYFPAMIERCLIPEYSQDALTKDLHEAGFTDIEFKPFFVTDELQDWFLHAGKYRPEIYLDPAVRAGISTFALAENKDEISEGLNRLEQDIESGEVKEIIDAYENDLGDYLFVAAQKP